MKKWISFGLSWIVALLVPVAAAAQHTGVPLVSSGAPYGYYEYLPDDYESIEEWPVVVFLHGLGETGNGTTQLSRVLALGLPRNIEQGEEYPFIVISPQSPGEWNVASIDAMIEFVKSNYRIDPDRIYLTGISLGGGGTWNYAKAHPEKLAAILDETDSTNDSGLDETDVNFNTAQSLNTGMTEPWLQDRDLSASPVVPQGRYQVCRSSPNMTDRAKEYAIVGFIDPDATP